MNMFHIFRRGTAPGRPRRSPSRRPGRSGSRGGPRLRMNRIVMSSGLPRGPGGTWYWSSCWARVSTSGRLLPREVLGLDLAGHPPVAEGEARPDGAVLALAVEVPAGAAALAPHALADLLLQGVVELALGLRGRLDGLRAALVHLVEHREDPLRLLLDHEHDRVVAEGRVGAEQEEEVREVGDRDAQVGLTIKKINPYRYFYEKNIHDIKEMLPQ
ncbi:hypothetical protein POVWA1_081120 [Plasmodium ovale wallikeri]|uniref:Uncharacterized protein n=1 Tax=Plasmodium ovale wallikeri TaxID=864142 RepID=A0A1A9AMA0_PLAOA|nr:hypothetical protein POVWA1_081120 [Plasmodium ovale wallikeri]